MRKVFVGTAWVVVAAAIYQFARATMPFAIVTLIAFSGLFYVVRRGARIAAAGVAEVLGERPYLVAFGLVAVAFLVASFVDYLTFGLGIWQPARREFATGTGFVEFVELRAQSGYGPLLGGELVPGGWPTIAVWVAWSGILALAAFAGVGGALRARSDDD